MPDQPTHDYKTLFSETHFEEMLIFLEVKASLGFNQYIIFFSFSFLVFHRQTEHLKTGKSNNYRLRNRAKLALETKQNGAGETWKGLGK